MTAAQRAPAVAASIDHLTRVASVRPTHIGEGGVGLSLVRLADLAVVLEELANPTAPDVSGAVSIPCAMSGPLEVLTVYPVGKRGVTFRYGEDGSVIVDGDELLKIRAIIDGQIGQPPFAGTVDMLAMLLAEEDGYPPEEMQAARPGGELPRWTTYRPGARRILVALGAQQVPMSGWMLAPEDPTEAMTAAADHARYVAERAEPKPAAVETLRVMYRAMLAAAPPPPDIGGESPTVREKALRDAIRCCEDAGGRAAGEWGMAGTAGADMAKDAILALLDKPAAEGGADG